MKYIYDKLFRIIKQEDEYLHFTEIRSSLGIYFESHLVFNVCKQSGSYYTVSHLYPGVHRFCQIIFMLFIFLIYDNISHVVLL